MTVRHVVAEQFTDVVTEHGEGAVWSDAWGGLKCVDLLAGDVLSITADGGVERTHVGRVAAMARPRVGGGMVVAVERSIVLLDADGERRGLPELFDDRALRFNEGSATPDGALLVGTMAYDQTPGAASVYRLDPDGTVSTVLSGVTVSNGLGFGPDGRVAFYNDTPTGRIDAFDYADGTLGNRRTFASVDGQPDGLWVDADGGVWTALFGGSAVHRYGPDGSLTHRIEVAASQVTSCTFGGPELDQLFITTSREGGVDEPAAGALFRCTPGVRGLPVLPFHG